MERIKEFSDNSYLKYDRGKFDEWCVFYCAANTQSPPRDIDYFSELKEIDSDIGMKKVYNDFVHIYEKTGKTVSKEVLSYITEISKSYDDTYSLKIDKIFTVLYMAMIAEECKSYTKLGKRIKRLGIFKLLVENESVYNSANFMRGMKWQEIDALCRERGF